MAASANFPVLLLSMLWKGLTTRGAFIGGFAGLISAVVLTIVSPGIWEAVLGYPKGSALLPLHVAGYLHHAAGVLLLLRSLSITDNSASAAKERAAFDGQYVRQQTGIGAEGAASH